MEPMTLVKCPECATRLVDDEDGIHCPACGWEPGDTPGDGLNGHHVECGHVTEG